jgi:hypothetical protein
VANADDLAFATALSMAIYGGFGMIAHITEYAGQADLPHKLDRTSNRASIPNKIVTSIEEGGTRGIARVFRARDGADRNPKPVGMESRMTRNGDGVTALWATAYLKVATCVVCAQRAVQWAAGASP